MDSNDAWVPFPLIDAVAGVFSRLFGADSVAVRRVDQDFATVRRVARPSLPLFIAFVSRGAEASSVRLMVDDYDAVVGSEWRAALETLADPHLLTQGPGSFTLGGPGGPVRCTYSEEHLTDSETHKWLEGLGRG